MLRLHIFVDSPTDNDLTKTELDIGIISQPYVAIAHCIRAGFCISHALRDWVRITIGFPKLGPYLLTLNPMTIRYMGTDERSILHIILRAQKARQRRNGKAPYGVTIHEEPIRGKLETCLNPEVLLLIPGQTPSWQLKASDFSQLAMYCPLYQNGDQIELDLPTIVHYDDSLPRDIAILDVVHTLDRF